MNASEGKVTDVSEELKARWSSLVEIDQLWSLSLAWEHILEHEHPYLFCFLAGGRPGMFIYFLHLSLIVIEHRLTSLVT